MHSGPTTATSARRQPRGGPAGPGTLGATLWLALAEQGRRFRRYRRRVLDGKDPEDLHQLRVALRRLRAALQLGKEALDIPETAEVRELARLGRALGRLRDLDVAIGGTEPLVPVAKGAEAATLGAVRARLRQQRRGARRIIRRVLAGPETDRAVRTLRRWVRDPRFFPFAFRGLGLTTPTLLAPAERAVAEHEGWAIVPTGGRVFSPEEDRSLHDLRERVKDLRYRIEILSRPAPDQEAARLQSLREMQDHLGRVHDAEAMDSLVSAAAHGIPARQLELIRRHLGAIRRAAAEEWIEARRAGYSGTVKTAQGAA
jgi:CHAD domain-containing protein